MPWHHRQAHPTQPTHALPPASPISNGACQRRRPTLRGFFPPSFLLFCLLFLVSVVPPRKSLSNPPSPAVTRSLPSGLRRSAYRIVPTPHHAPPPHRKREKNGSSPCYTVIPGNHAAPFPTPTLTHARARVSKAPPLEKKKNAPDGGAS
ncbi:hypothetical protein BS50DRAFT_134713 [Corynespora cassiicola Philippines]|uniref:Uncharacterized protein n=1 Tax=Corynespora cassiicola Philippines TaxID=1448308 RepID=A0A2T2N9R7_CORCC|nr:hypothetical protein BS50DRAFT_134713 [Corynespora cassiicola Philippines]